MQTPGRRHGALTRGPASSDGFTFVQLADPQLGMMASFKEIWWVDTVRTITCQLFDPPIPVDTSPALPFEDIYALEVQHSERAVDAINGLSPTPAFAVVCGDLVHAYPGHDLNPQQIADFKRIFSRVRPEVPLVCLCGNHDIGDRPTPTAIAMWRDEYQTEDYFTFWVQDTKFVVLNTQLWKDGSDAVESAEAQNEWMRALVEETQREHPSRVITLSHIPPFIETADEPDGYFNLETTIRKRLLSQLSSIGCDAWFCGHYHRNAGGVYDGERPLEVVISSAVGATLTNKTDGSDIRGLKGMNTVGLDMKTSGIRLVNVGPRSYA